jgi:hypothetical protein
MLCREIEIYLGNKIVLLKNKGLNRKELRFKNVLLKSNGLTCKR